MVTAMLYTSTVHPPLGHNQFRRVFCCPESQTAVLRGVASTYTYTEPSAGVRQWHRWKALCVCTHKLEIIK
ncbi:MAG: hypothetical protein ACI4TW_08660 [Prevotella sp.]